ncbi:MAG: hypothetical protein ABIH99_06075 [Candidatus Micrarchaeota archaeon]
MDRKKGLIFTVDSFIALLLVTFTILTLLTLISFPASRAVQLRQMNALARDSLTVLENTANPADSSESQLQEIGRNCLGSSSTPGIMRPLIPEQYGFAVYCTDSAGNSRIVYSTQTTPPQTPLLQAVATRVSSGLAEKGDPGTPESSPCEFPASSSYRSAETWGPSEIKMVIWTKE